MELLSRAFEHGDATIGQNVEVPHIVECVRSIDRAADAPFLDEPPPWGLLRERRGDGSDRQPDC
jgi:hypothetical protein